MWVDKENPQDPYNRVAPLNSPAVGAGGGSGAPTGGTTTNGGTVSNPSTQVSSGPTPEPQKFASVQDYLGANQQQGEALGQKFTGRLADTAGQERTDIAGAADQTKNDITAGTTNFNSGLVNNAVKDPTAVAGDPGQLNDFLKQWNASYSGPQSFENSANYGKAADAATKANEKQQELSSAGGQQQLLQDEFGVYGQGNKGLDQTLLQTSSAFPEVQRQSKNFGGVADYLKQQSGDVNTIAQNAKAATDAARTSTRQPFTNSLTQFQSDINAKVAAAKDPQTALHQSLQKSLSDGNTEKALRDLTTAGVPAGVAQDIVQNLLTLSQTYQSTPDNLGNYLSNPNATVTPANAASAQDYDKAQALQTLTGVDYSGVLNPANRSQAGTSAQPLVKSDELSKYLKTSVGQSDKQLLDKTNLPDVFSVLKIPNILDVSNAGNPGTGSNAAQALINAVNRTGVTKDSQAKLAQFQSAAEQQYRKLGTPATSQDQYVHNPVLAGLATFIKMLSGFTKVPTDLGTPIISPPTPPVKPGNGVASGGGTPYVDPKTGEKKIAY